MASFLAHLGPYEIPATVLHSPSHLAQPFALPRSYAAGCFLCTDLQARAVHKKLNPHQDLTTLPAALAIGVGRCRLSRRRELRHDGVLRSWLRGSASGIILVVEGDIPLYLKRKSPVVDLIEE
jgi:hypothetical protein